MRSMSIVAGACGVFASVAVLTGCGERARVEVRRPEAPKGPQEKILDAEMAKWRCDSRNVRVDAFGEACGKRNVLRFAYPMQSGAKDGSVCVADYDLRPMLGSWIPPYVGTRAKKFVCAVRPSGVSGDIRCQLRCRANPSWNSAKWKVWSETNVLERAGGDFWTEVGIDCALGAYERLADICFLFEGSGGCTLDVAEMRVVLDDGSCYAIVNDAMPSYRTGMDKPYSTKPLRAFPKRPRIQFGIGQQWIIEYKESLGELGAYMGKYLPEYDVVLSLGNAIDPRAIDSMRSAPPNVFFQWQGGQHDLRYAGLLDALVRNKDGRAQFRKFNSTVGTHPLFQRALEDQIAYLGTMGFNNIQRYDYVWYYPDGPSGFDKASIAAFREDLQEKDEGLDLLADGLHPAQRIHFWEYYRDYYGAPLQPQAVGLAGWDEYVPKLDTETREMLHWTLVSYEWLRLAQRFGEWSERHCYGSPYDFLLNGEFKGDGNDHVYLSRLRTSGICSPEFFSFALKNVNGYYCGAGRYLRNARACGKRFGVTLETSRGGSGSQPYWSAKTGYALSYLLSALGFDGFEYDGIPGHCSWADYVSGKNAFDTAELKLGMADARGYRQAKLDGARPRPSRGVYHVCNRPVVGKRTPFSQDALAEGEYVDFRYELRKEEVEYATTDPQELPAVLDTARLIFVSPDVRREVVDKVLVPWAKQPKHVLVTNKAECARIFALPRLPRLQKPAKDGFAPVEVLPFDCRQGAVAVLFNRKACAEADREKWYEKVWRPVVYKRTFDPNGLLYFDKVPDASASAEVPVAEDGSYRVYRLISGREETVEARDGYLRLDLRDDLTDVFYYGLDCETYRSYLETVKRERILTADFFD